MTFGIINVLLRTVNAKAFLGNFKFSRGVSESQEGKHPDQDTYGTGLNTLESSNIDSLAVITKPISKIGSFNHHGGPFMTFDEGYRLKHILNLGEGVNTLSCPKVNG